MPGQCSAGPGSDAPVPEVLGRRRPAGGRREAEARRPGRVMEERQGDRRGRRPGDGERRAGDRDAQALTGRDAGAGRGERDRDGHHLAGHDGRRSANESAPGQVEEAAGEQRRGPVRGHRLEAHGDLRDRPVGSQPQVDDRDPRDQDRLLERLAGVDERASVVRALVQRAPPWGSMPVQVKGAASAHGRPAGPAVGRLACRRRALAQRPEAAGPVAGQVERRRRRDPAGTGRPAADRPPAARAARPARRRAETARRPPARRRRRSGPARRRRRSRSPLSQRSHQRVMSPTPSIVGPGRAGVRPGVAPRARGSRGTGARTLATTARTLSRYAVVEAAEGEDRRPRWSPSPRSPSRVASARRGAGGAARRAATAASPRAGGSHSSRQPGPEALGVGRQGVLADHLDRPVDALPDEAGAAPPVDVQRGSGRG